MNKDKLRDLCLNLSKKSGLSFNVVQTQYFLESILKKLVQSIPQSLTGGYNFIGTLSNLNVNRYNKRKYTYIYELEDSPWTD